MISGRSCLPREPSSNRNEIPAAAVTSSNTIGDGALGELSRAVALGGQLAANPENTMKAQPTAHLSPSEVP